MTGNDLCIVCKRSDATISDLGSQRTVKCRLCGTYELATIEYRQMTSMPFPGLFSAWIRARQEAGAPPPTITSLTWESLKQTVRAPSVREKQAAMMKAFAKRTMFPGTIGKLTRDSEYSLAWASNEGELRYLIDDLIQRKLLDQTATVGNSFLITPAGWDYIDSLPSSEVFSDQVFVAMSFSQGMRSSWLNSIAPAVKRAGYTPYRVDAVPHIDRIDNKIMAEIKGSKFVVADVTEQKAGVYFEAGYAIGLGLPVIWTVREDDLPKVHFDTRQYAHIVWQDEREFEEKLLDTITVVVGRGKADWGGAEPLKI